MQDVHPPVGAVERKLATFRKIGFVCANIGKGAVRTIEIKGVDASTILVGDEHEAAHAVVADVWIAALIDKSGRAQKRIRNKAESLGAGTSAERKIG